jgi:pyruvate dehydrogenase E2 component (dihydrolipoamide acetyltransferase)
MIMAEKIILPKQGLQMTEGIITEWFVSEGGEVVKGQPLFAMETDKTIMTVDAEVSGILLQIMAPVGTVVPIAQTIAIVGAAGEDIVALLLPEEMVSPSTSGIAVSGPVAATVPAALVPSIPDAGRITTAAGGPAGPVSGGKVFISPRAKMRAMELGIDHAPIRGSAPGGMIVERDILTAYAARPKASPLAKKTAELLGADLSGINGTGVRGKIMREDVIRARRSGGETRNLVPMKGMRKVIAERMKQSLNENAQACHRITVRMDEAVRLRQALEKTVSYNDFIALAVIRALMDFPEINAELTPEGIWQKDFVNLGIAVAVDKGLIVPVVKNADLLNLKELSTEIKALTEKARNGALQPEDYTGGSFTVSNLGMYGLEEFVAIINPPEAGILAVGKIEDTPIAVKGNIEIHPIVKLTLSYDHRVVDGAPAAQFLLRIKESLENPFRLL